MGQARYFCKGDKHILLNRLLKILRNTLLIVVSVVMLLVILVNLTSVQNFIARKAVESLATKLKTKVSVKHVRIDFLNHVLLQGLYIEDRSHDTLLYAGEAQLRITDWFFLQKEKPVLHYIGLHNAYAHLYRNAATKDWNYQFIADAFDTGPSKKQKDTAQFELDLKKIDLQNVRFHMDDAWIGSDMDFDVGSLTLDANNIDLRKHIIDIDAVDINKTAVIMRDYIGGRPPKPKIILPIDTTPFNDGKWLVKAKSLSLYDCLYSLDSDPGKPTPDEFDPSHIGVRNIMLEARNISIVGDTLKSKILNLAAKERCGVMIKKMRSDVTVSPNASICDNLYLETNNSVLKHYYAMRYTRFPDFKEYIDKVVMEGKLDNSSIDSRDVAYFAPVLRKYPTIIKASGHVIGTVDSLVGTKLSVMDGSSIVRGDIRMIGLPDIYTTFIDFRNGEIYTSGAGILRYAPELRHDPNIAFENITHAYFKGDFTGYIENFAANGTLVSNLGTIQANSRLKMLEMKQRNAIYSGTISTTNFNVGALFRQSDLGDVTFKATISGNAFDPAIATVKLNSTIDHLTYRGYAYHNVTAEGTLAKNKFNGNLLVDDPNLALAFYGDMDFSGKDIRINAKANLLKSDLTALKLTKDSVTASADFDMDWQGNNIDNFLGYAKLFNINLVRNGHRLDLDSVYLNSTRDNNGKLITIESNIFTASIQGNFLLTRLPYSFQYYVSGYLPNYIKAPTKYAPDQTLNFEVTTHNIDSLLGVLAPGISGFYNTSVKGSLDMPHQRLTLNAKIPYGSIYNVHLGNVNINGDGDFNVLGLSAEAEKIILGDSTYTGSASITTTLGNDSLLFNIATNTATAFGTATLNGRAIARGDSLFLTLLPSDFYFNHEKWEIPAGNSIVLADKYLDIQNLFIQSGIQQISVHTNQVGGVQSLAINTKDLDLNLLNSVSWLADYQPEGRINGKITLDSLFRNTYVNVAVHATDVKLAGDTLGTVNLVGNYNIQKNIVTLDGQSGLYKGNFSLTASGHLVLFDSTSRQSLDGSIQFNNAPISWLNPLLVGYVSKLDGSLNGTVNVKGTAAVPDIDGSVNLDNGAVHIDFLGTDYTIPKAQILVTNSEINFGKIVLYDKYKNTGTVTGNITHDRFKNMRLNLNATSPKLEVLNLHDYENSTFYGTLIAGFQNLSVRGPLDDISMRITQATPADKSHLYLPIGTTSAGISSYNYVSFKTYGTTQTVKRKTKNKLDINIDARLNELAEITLVLDPATGDAINAKGTGNLNMDIPLGNDIRMYGVYDMSEGNYQFTLKQLAFRRNFALYAGSRITFNGPIAQTVMNVDGAYTTRARLYDMLTTSDKAALAHYTAGDRENQVAKTVQSVNVLLNMQGSLDDPKLTFKLDVPDKHGIGTIAYLRVESVNQYPDQLLNEVASLLLINSFVSADAGDFGSGFGGSSTATGAISNVSELISGTASSQITNIVNKITGDKNLAVDLRYKQYSYTDEVQNSSGNRNEVTLGIRKSYFNDRLSVQVGSAYDWGRPAAATSNNTGYLTGDFRAEYQLKEGGNVRLNIFRTSNYDVLAGNITRAGAGISWRKSFDSFDEFWHGVKYGKRATINKMILPDSSKEGQGGND